MAAATVETAPPAPELPDYMTDPNATLNDKDASWRFGRAPDYTNTRRVYEETKSMSHEAGSLEMLVQNLVKNWEVEVSFKNNVQDWRTVDPSVYTFAINGGPTENAESMLKLGTYNAIIAPNEFYSPKNSDFASSHKTFKRMMPTFAWEVLEVYSGPPRVSFKWRHWGTMKNDYVGFNDKGEKVTAKAHGGSIDIQGVTVAKVNEKLQVESLETWFDPLEMFRQIAPKGIVSKVVVPKFPGQNIADALDAVPEDQPTLHAHDVNPQPTFQPRIHTPGRSASPTHFYTPKSGTDRGLDIETTTPSSEYQDIQTRTRSGPDLQKLIDNVSNALDALKLAVAMKLSSESSSSPNSPTSHTWVKVPEASRNTEQTYLQPHATNCPTTSTNPFIQLTDQPGQAITTGPESEETKITHEEMSNISPSECPFLMNRE